MKKRMINWTFYTVIAGLLPLLFILILCKITNTVITYESVCSEIFFFNIMLSADTIKTLYEIEKKSDAKRALSATTVFMLICEAVFYGIMSINNYIDNLNLNLEWAYRTSIILSVLCFITSAIGQILGGANNE